MKCGRKYFISLLVFLVLWQGLSYAEVCLTEDEYQEFSQILTELQALTIQQHAELTTLGQELRTSRSNLRIAQSELTDSQIAIAEARRLSQEAEQSYKQQRRVIIVSSILAGLGASLLAFTFGFAVAR